MSAPEVNLAELAWLAPVDAQLTAALQAGRLAHALLFDGPVGLGKLALAERFATRVLCRDDRGDPCGLCRNCVLCARGNHPDLTLIVPEEGKATIAIEQVRQLIRSLSLQSHAGGHKVAIVAPADCMTASAANALLKTLEEPTANTVLMLVSARPSRLPATIRSRCQRVRFVAPAREQALEWLASRDEQEVRWPAALELAGGAPLEALRLAALGQGALAADLAADLAGIVTGRTDPLGVAARWASAEPRHCLRWLQRCVATLIRERVGGQKAGTDHGGAQNDLRTLLGRLDLTSVFHYLDELQAAIALLDSQANVTLLIEALLVPWADGGRGLRGHAPQ